ncbi:MAG: hypothetical protein R3F19_15460 [Verrucomicrobiales bacterium]|nr:hypothetical protein [Verrucomicrobiae bacterium]
MKFRFITLSQALILGSGAWLSAASADDTIREWRSASGSVVRGELIEVRDGKAIIRPETKLIEAPLDKLAQADQEYAAVWAKKQERIIADRAEADLLLAKTKPLGKALIGRTVTIRDKQLVPYEVKDVSKLDYVLLYLTQEGVTNDVDTLNRLYKRLKSRYDNVEFVAMAYGKTTTEANQALIDAGVEFPIAPQNMLNSEGAEALTQLYARKVVPQIAVIDAAGQIVADSYRAPDPDAKKKEGKSGEWTGPKQDLKEPVAELQKLLRALTKVSEEAEP